MPPPRKLLGAPPSPPASWYYPVTAAAVAIPVGAASIFGLWKLLKDGPVERPIPYVRIQGVKSAPVIKRPPPAILAQSLAGYHTPPPPTLSAKMPASFHVLQQAIAASSPPKEIVAAAVNVAKDAAAENPALATQAFAIAQSAAAAAGRKGKRWRKAMNAIKATFRKKLPAAKKHGLLLPQGYEFPSSVQPAVQAVKEAVAAPSVSNLQAAVTQVSATIQHVAHSSPAIAAAAAPALTALNDQAQKLQEVLETKSPMLAHQTEAAANIADQIAAKLESIQSQTGRSFKQFQELGLTFGDFPKTLTGNLKKLKERITQTAKNIWANTGGTKEDRKKAAIAQINELQASPAFQKILIEYIQNK